MKKLKKTVCVLLAMLLLCGIFAVQVSAQEEQEPDMDALRQQFIAYLEEKGIIQTSPEPPKLDSIVVSFILASTGWTIFYGTAGLTAAMPQSDRIGNYVFMSYSWERPYKLGLYAEKDGVILTLKEAYDAGRIDIDSIAQAESPYINVYLPGDADMDGTVTVQDVLFVQKVISKKTGMENFYSEFNLCDYDASQEINLKDVLGMQKQIAKVS